MMRIKFLALAMAASASIGGWSAPVSDRSLKDDPFARQSRSKGEKARNKKLRGCA